MRRQAKGRKVKAVAFLIKTTGGRSKARTPFASSSSTLSEGLIARALRKYSLDDERYELYILEE